MFGATGQMVPSFFPTASEFSIGLKWLKDHPVAATAAAAAATAVSVFTYLRQEEPVSSEPKVNWGGGGVASDLSLSDGYSECDLQDAANDSSDLVSSLEQCKVIHSSRSTIQSTIKRTKSNLEGDQQHHIGNDRSSSEMPFDDTTTSPQWGWYVAITPPQEQYVRRPFPASIHGKYH